MNNTTLGLVPLILRGRAFHLAWIPLLVALLIGWSAYLTLESRHLSPEQVAHQRMGNSDMVTVLATELRTGDKVPAIPDLPPGVHLDAHRISTDLLIKDGDSTDNQLMLEQQWPSVATEGVYEVASGRWPRKAGEVMISDTDTRASVKDPQVARGSLNLNVVGTYRDTYAKSSSVLLAAPGTLDAWDLSDEDLLLFNTNLQQDVYWSADDAPSRVGEVEAVLPVAMSATQSAAEVGAFQEEPSWRDRVERFFPAFLAGLIGALATGMLSRRYVHRILTPLSDAGLATGSLRTAVLTAGLIGLAITTLAAWLGSVAITEVMRSTWLANADFALSPRHLWGSPPTWSLAAATLIIAAFVAQAVAPRRSENRGGLPAWAWALAGAACLAWGLLNTSGEPGWDLWVPMLLAIALGVALLVAAALKLIPSRGTAGPQLMGRRMLTTQPGIPALAVATVLLTGVVATPLAVAGGLTASKNDKIEVVWPRGMVLYSDGTDPVPEMQLKAQFERDLGLAEPIPGWYAFGEGPTEDGMTFRVATVDDVARLLGGLSPEQRAHVSEHGSINVSPDTDTADTVSMEEPDTVITWVGVGKPTDPAPDAAVSFYVDTTPEQDRKALTWAQDNGYPVGISASARQDPLPIPMGAQLAAGGYGVLAGLLGLVAMQGLVRALRPTLAGLTASGLDSSWLRRVVLTAGGWLGALTATGAAAATGLSIVAVRQNLMNQGVDFPFGGLPLVALIAIVLGTLVGTLLGAWWAARGITVTERHS